MVYILIYNNLMEKKFYKTRKDRKYLSIMDEYRRYYVTGKNIKLKNAYKKNMGDLIFELAVKEILKPIIKSNVINKDDLYYKNLVSGIKIGSTKYRQDMKIIEFKRGRLFVFQYRDSNKNIYRIIIEVKSNSSNKLHYSEWVKKEKTFFGLQDTVGKILMRKSIVRKTKLLKRKLNHLLFNIKSKEFKFENQKRNWEKDKNIQLNSKGFLSRKKQFINNDLGARYDKNIVAPDATSREIEGLEEKFKNEEEK